MDMNINIRRGHKLVSLTPIHNRLQKLSRGLNVSYNHDLFSCSLINALIIDNQQKIEWSSFHN